MKNNWRLLTLSILATALLCLTFVAHADDDEEVKIESLEINKDSIAEGISMLEKSGQITAEQAKAAREDLNKKSDGEIEALKSVAMERVKSGNIPTLPQASANKPAVTPVAVEATTPAPVLAPASSATVATPQAVTQPAAAATQNTDAKLKEALQFIQK